jgi:hypothetical protein
MIQIGQYCFPDTWTLKSGFGWRKTAEHSSEGIYIDHLDVYRFYKNLTMIEFYECPEIAILWAEETGYTPFDPTQVGCFCVPADTDYELLKYDIDQFLMRISEVSPFL